MIKAIFRVISEALIYSFGSIEDFCLENMEDDDMSSKFHGGNKGKDKLLLKSYIEYLVPRVYASIACELWDAGWSAEDIQNLFAKSQERWRDSVDNGWDMLENVQEVTGIEVKYFKEKGNIV